MQFPRQVTVTEVVFRDGFQTAPKFYPLEEKIKLIEMVVDAGCKSVEVGAFSNYESMKMMRDSNDIFKRIKQKTGVEYRALFFAPDGAREASECGCRSIKLNISASDQHHKGGTGMTTKDAMQNFETIAAIACDNNMYLLGSISLPFVSPFPGEGIIPLEVVTDIIRAFVSVGVTEISLADAAGMATPKMIYERASELADAFPELKWILHMHNTYGMGLANVTAAMCAGISKFDAALAGMGGCPYLPGASGNVATEDIVYMLNSMAIDTGIDLDRLLEAGQFVRRMAGDMGMESCQQRLNDIRGRTR